MLTWITLKHFHFSESNYAPLIRPFHNLFLSHVIVPLHISQVDKLIKSFDTWTRYPPCNIQSDDLPFRRPTLVFQISYSENSQPDLIAKEQKRCFEAFQKLNFAGCFERVISKPLKIPKVHDTHVSGARLMFEDMVNGKLTDDRNDVGYALYMEPDTKPIRRYWMSWIAMRVPYMPEFWVLGSIFRGGIELMATDKLPERWHINGNAIYNLQSKGFRNFYRDVRNYVVKNHGDSLNAYDTDMFEYIHWNYDKGRHVLHKYVYADWIQNVWKSPYSAEEMAKRFPETVLVHGNNVIPPTLKQKNG